MPHHHNHGHHGNHPHHSHHPHHHHMKGINWKHVGHQFEHFGKSLGHEIVKDTKIVARGVEKTALGIEHNLVNTADHLLNRAQLPLIIIGVVVVGAVIYQSNNR
jgi:hypothetical protein